MKSKTGQRIKGQVMEAIGGLKDDAITRGHAALSQHQFPSSPPWGGDAPAAPSSSAPPWDVPSPAGAVASKAAPWEGAPSDFNKPNSPPPPW